jgi:hypothetical protein
MRMKTKKSIQISKNLKKIKNFKIHSHFNLILLQLRFPQLTYCCVQAAYCTNAVDRKQWNYIIGEGVLKKKKREREREIYHRIINRSY